MPVLGTSCLILYSLLKRAAKEIFDITGGKLDVLTHAAAKVVMQGFED